MRGPIRTSYRQDGDIGRIGRGAGAFFARVVEAQEAPWGGDSRRGAHEPKTRSWLQHAYAQRPGRPLDSAVYIPLSLT